MITTEDRFDFFTVIYFSNDYSDFKQKAIWRAFRDFSRTLRYKNFENTAEIISNLKKNWENELLNLINEVCSKKFNSQENFDIWHEEKTVFLSQLNKKGINVSVGQSQKWINMTFKYLFLFDEKNVPGISKNVEFFHIPIDNIIQCSIQKKLKINKIPQPWSGITEYGIYLQYQKSLRKKLNEISPFEYEFKLFNDEEFEL